MLHFVVICILVKFSETPIYRESAHFRALSKSFQSDPFGVWRILGNVPI